MRELLMRTVVYLVLAAVAGLAGYYIGSEDVASQIDERRDHIVTQWKDRIVTKTRTVHPDGTVTETEVTEDKSGKSKEHSSEKIVTRSPSLSNYSLGVKYWASYSDLVHDISTFNSQAVEIELGRRIIGEVWLDLGIRQHEFALGLSVRF